VSSKVTELGLVDRKGDLMSGKSVLKIEVSKYLF